MSIIAVNINRNVKRLPVQIAIQQAWKLNPKRASKCIYVIGVVNGIVQGYFRILNTYDIRYAQNNRVEFQLTICSRNEWEYVNKLLITKNVNLSGFVTKYIP